MLQSAGIHICCNPISMSANPKLARICPKNQNSESPWRPRAAWARHKLLYIQPHGPAEHVGVGGREIGPMRVKGIEGLAGSIAQLDPAEVLLIEGSWRILRGVSPGTWPAGAALPRVAGHGGRGGAKIHGSVSSTEIGDKSRIASRAVTNHQSNITDRRRAAVGKKWWQQWGERGWGGHGGGRIASVGEWAWLGSGEKDDACKVFLPFFFF